MFPQIAVVAVASPGLAMQARVDAANADAWSTNSGPSIILYSLIELERAAVLQ